MCGVGPLDTLPGQVIGAKPAAMFRWIFTLPGDMLGDLFPGSGAVGWLHPVQVVQAVCIGAEPCLELASRPRVVGADTRLLHTQSLLILGVFLRLL